MRPDRPRALIALLGGAALALLALGYGAYRSQDAAMEQAAHQQLAFLAREKADRIDTWLAERIGDARTMAEDPLLVDQLRRIPPGRGPAPELSRKLFQRLETVRESYGYASALLLAPDGSTLAAAGSDLLLPWEAAAAGAGQGASPRIIWNVHQDPRLGPRLAMACVAPIRADRPLATLVLRLDPRAALGAEALGDWPNPTPSGETLLLARLGGEALFLNRTRREGAPVLREPITRTDLVGVQALLSGDGLQQGVDYRGVPSVAVSRRLAGLPWTLVAKLDRDEYLRPVRRLLGTYTVLGALFLGLAAAFVAALNRHVRARERAERGRLEAEGRARTRQLELLGRYGNDLVLVMDPQGRILEANDRALEAYQYGRDQIRALNVTDLRAPEVTGDFAAQFERVKQTSNLRFETVHRRRDGTVFPVEVSSMALELDGRPLVQSIIRDITERREYEARIRALNEGLEQRVRERTRELETAFRQMEALSYSVSHDLRAPLRGIDGFSHALLEDFGDRLDPRGRHYLERIRAAAQHLGRVMDDLLELIRLGRHELVPASVDLSAQAREILEGLERQALGRRRVDLAIQDGLRAQADPRLMRVVLAQLLDNAWKFTAGTERARIEFGAAPDPGGGATFFVRDNGAGFDMAYAGRLFEAFQRLHDPGQYKGTGIGLAIAQRILQRHGGRIWAEAAAGKGASFFFNLPA